MRSLLAFALVAVVAVNAQSDGVGLAIGGFGGSNTIEIITEDDVCQGTGSDPGIPNTSTGSIEGWVSEYVDGKVYLCGGGQLGQQSECYMLTIGGSTWEYSGLMDDAREYPASFVFNGEMVVCGGYNTNAGWVDTCEKKVAGSEVWEEMNDWDLNIGTFDFCMQQVDDTHFIAIGGNIYGQDYVDHTSIFDTATNTWEEQEPLPFGRSSHTCLRATIDGEEGVLVIGGCSNYCQNTLDNVEFFGYTSRTWTALPPLNQPRRGAQIAVIGGVPTVVGGYHPDEGNKISIEQWIDGEWVVSSNSLSAGRWGFGMPDYIPSSEVTC